MEPESLHISITTPPPRSCASLFVQWVIWTIVSIFLMISIIIAIAWLVLNPREPGFRVSSVSVSDFSVSDSQLKGRYEIDLKITNPNKKTQVRVDHFKFFVCYDSLMLSEPEVVQQTIHVNKMNDKDMKVELRLKDTPPPTKLGHNKDLVKDWKKGVVNFKVEMKARVTYESRIWTTKEKLLDVHCGDLDVGFVPNKDTGKLRGIGKDCDVTTLTS